MRVVYASLLFQQFLWEMCPKLNLQNTWILSIFIKFYIIYFNCEIRHLHPHIINDFNVFLIQFFQLLEEQCHDDDAKHVTKHNNTACTFLVDFVSEGYLYSVILAAYYGNEMWASDLLVINSLDTVIRHLGDQVKVLTIMIIDKFLDRPVEVLGQISICIWVEITWLFAIAVLLVIRFKVFMVLFTPEQTCFFIISLWAIMALVINVEFRIQLCKILLFFLNFFLTYS